MMDVHGDPAGLNGLVRRDVLRGLERPDRAAFDPSSAVHDRLDRDAERPAPGSDVLPQLLGLKVGLAHAPSMPHPTRESMPVA